MEKALLGKNLFDKEILEKAFEKLTKYMKPETEPGESSPEFRKQLTKNLFYKSLLSVCHDKDYAIDTDQISQSIQLPVTIFGQKTEDQGRSGDLMQIFRGLGNYSEDLLHHPEDLYCYFVTAKKIHHRFVSADPSTALVSLISFIHNQYYI